MSFGFGQQADDYNPPSAGGDFDEIWIKGFQAEKNTGAEKSYTIRILDGNPGKWAKYREHYEASVRHFPCGEDGGYSVCPGCTDEAERVRSRSWRYAFNGQNEEGRVSIYKLPKSEWLRFKQRFGRSEETPPTISDRDWIIRRSGNTKDDTLYDIDSGKIYPLELWPQKYDIPRVLDDKFRAVCEAYGVDPGPSPLDSPDYAPAPDDYPPAYCTGGAVPSATDEAAAPAGDEAQADPAAAFAAAAAADAERAEAAPSSNGATPDADASRTAPEKVSEWPSERLLEFLKEKGIEVKQPAPRSRLVKTAQEWVDKNPAF